MSVTRLPLEKSTTRVLGQKRIITARNMPKSDQDNTLLSFVRSLENSEKGTSRKNQQPQKVQSQLIYQDQQQLKVGPQPVKVMGDKMQQIRNLEKEMSKLTPQEKEYVDKAISSIQSGEQKTHEIVGVLAQKRLQFRILSNYGNSRFVGLTGIELFESDGKNIQVNGIFSDSESKEPISNLINGQNITINENQMWVTSNVQFPITITLTYDSDKLNMIKIWNYNKNRLELNKGIKKLEIILNDNILWTGEIAKGVAHTYTDFATIIELKQNVANNTNQFYQSMQSMNSKKSDDNNKETNISKNSSKYSRPKLLSNPFDDDFKYKKLENVEPQSVKTKVAHGRFFQKPVTLFQKQHTEEDVGSIPIRKGVAYIAAGNGTGRSKRITIPETPIGSKLIFKIISNWGDLNYVGLTGIELFNCSGDQIRVFNAQGFFKKPDILFDQNCMTQDEKNMCLGRIGKQMEVKIEIEEDKIAMIRVWNYNKGRIYTGKCVKQLEISLDGYQIFSGEIKKANGSCGAEDAEFIMFTQNQQIIKKIQDNDWLNQLHESQLEQQKHVLETTQKVSRPNTATFNKQATPPHKLNLAKQSFLHFKKDSQSNIKQQKSQGSINSIEVQKLTILIHKNWGDRFQVGLDRIELHNKQGIPYDTKLFKITYKMNNSQYQSVKSCTERWSSPNVQIQLQFKFKERIPVSRILVWNFNKEDELEKGVQLISVSGDGQLLTSLQGVYVHKGSGLKEQDPQIIDLPYTQNIHPIHLNYNQYFETSYYQNYETPSLPQGGKLIIKLISTWGDLHYIGLNGIEIFNPVGDLQQCKLIALPHSLKELPSMNMDARTPDKLLNGRNRTLDPRNMWIAPFVNSYTERLQSNINSSLFEQINYQVNKLYFFFDQPTQISAVSFYNYSRTPARGVREIEISMDDAIIYRGYLNISTLSETPKGMMGDNKTTILFTKDEQLIEQINTVSIRESMLGKETIMINEKITENTIRNAYVHKPKQQYYSLDRPTTTQIY